ncbi:MAG: hypothetical protein LBE03_00675 [Candidatus Nomurabacteria bacterium]|jgi:beta-lactamase regulating signal transducer with metallopeptidase domain|nr:hypothetical protein [Candidatus Nomurabacteria bacterium]
MDDFKTKIRRIRRFLRDELLNFQNIGTFVAIVICLLWIAGSVMSMQKIYTLQKRNATKEREAAILELETAEVENELIFHQTAEYQELALREQGMAFSNEKMLILPENSEYASNKHLTKTADTTQPQSSNWHEWVQFLFGS